LRVDLQAHEELVWERGGLKDLPRFGECVLPDELRRTRGRNPAEEIKRTLDRETQAADPLGLFPRESVTGSIARGDR
jgi:hypothetical protein